MMNKDNAKEFLPLVQALIDGKTIQYYSHEAAQWKDMTAVNFIYDSARYRIKPERIKKKMWYHPGSNITTGLYPVAANAFTHENWTESGWKIVEVEFDVP